MGNVYAKADAGGGGNGSSWAQAFDPGEMYDWIEDTSAAGDTLYVLTGTYTLGESIIASTRDGTAANPIKIIGVDSESNEPPTTSDWASGNDRPLLELDAATYAFVIGDYWMLANLRAQSKHADGVNGQHYCGVWNCYFEQTSGSANYEALYLGTRANCVGVEATGSNAAGIRVSSYGSFFQCYVHDCRTGIWAGYANVLNRCVADTIDLEGFYVPSAYLRIYNNVLYNCNKGISAAGTANGHVILGNLFEDNVYGAYFNNNYGDHWVDYNNWHDNSTANTNNLTEGPNATAYDPQFVDAVNGDFRLKSGSLCRQAGMPLTLGVGGASIKTAQGVFPNVGKHRLSE